MTSLFLSATCWPLVSLVSRRPVFSAGTCPPSARVLSAHTPTTNCALGAAGSLSSTSSRLSLRRHVFSSHTRTLSSARTQARHVLSAPRRFFHSHSLTLFALRPLLGRRILSPPIGGGHASFPRHRDRWFFTPGEIPAVCFICTQPTRKTPSHDLEFLAGNLATSPSIPRGMSPHGARWLWVPFDGVGSCGGGGVVASLMDGLCGSEEYNVEARNMMWKRGV